MQQSDVMVCKSIRARSDNVLGGVLVLMHGWFGERWG